MKTIKNLHKLEKGQVLPILVVGVFVMIIMAALILDGGAIMVNRRSAQNAADAAVLSAAREFCNNEYHFNKDDEITDIKEDKNVFIGYNIPTGHTIRGIIESYVEKNDPDDEKNSASVIWGYPNTYIDISNPNSIEGLKKGEVVVTVQIEHGSFFAGLIGYDTLTARATAAAGCFPFGPDVVLPIAFPCQMPVRDSEEGVSKASEDCDYVMLDWEYFDSVATDGEGIDGFSGCGMSNNPLLEGVTPKPAQTECISDFLTENHPDLVYVIMNEDKFCAKDPENVEYGKEIVCSLFGDGASQINTSSRGWLNLSDGNAGTNTIVSWINGNNNPELHEHVWLSFLGGTRAQPVFTALETRLLDIVYIPVFNYICDWKPAINDTCWQEAHTGAAGVVGVPDTEGVCRVIAGNPGNDFAHVVAFAPFFTTCVRNNSKDLENYIKDKNYGYDPTKVDEFYKTMDCPGFGLAASVAVTDSNGITKYPNMYALEKNNYSFEGFFINPQYLDNPENVSEGGVNLGIYTVSLTR